MNPLVPPLRSSQCSAELGLRSRCRGHRAHTTRRRGTLIPSFGKTPIDLEIYKADARCISWLPDSTTDSGVIFSTLSRVGGSTLHVIDSRERIDPREECIDFSIDIAFGVWKTTEDD